MDLIEVMELWNALGKVRDKRMPVKISFAISRNISLLTPIVRDVQQQRSGIIQKYIERDPDGKAIIDADGGAKITDPEVLETELNTLFSEESDVKIRMIPEEAFLDCDNERYDAFTPGEISALSAMIEYKTQEDNDE